ncbi:hypothetical protein C5615_33845 [Burkholderia cepacia]|uniref:Uncharacterized protein n=1 Tax=Burkholderia cepacia TaxID=292 RepID=A0A2S8I625_BURCE|nr:hypothetical protein C5615_33845 [Burkholderia cepacia]
MIRPARFDEAKDDLASMCRQAGMRFRDRRRIQSNETAFGQVVKIGRIARSAPRFARENHQARQIRSGK